MQNLIKGLHHITATVDDAQEDLDCYVKALGLRLVKKTVNFDNHAVYHFYYGNEAGTPGTLMTTFPYKGYGVPRGVHGAGQPTATAFSIPSGSADFWRKRLERHGFRTREEVRFGDAVLVFRDPSGLVIELIENDQDERAPWVPADDAAITAETAVRGIYAPTLSIWNPDVSIRFLTDVLGWTVTAEEGPRTRLVAGGDLPGHRIEVLHTPDAPRAVNGLGTVHHVAMAVESDEAQQTVREHLIEQGVNVTPVRDRQYFHSIYFREPGGVLYEVATLPPGFAIDEEPSELGQNLRLPPWEEKHRAQIEAGLATVSY